MGKLVNFFKGRKTYLVAFCAIALGLYTNDNNMIVTGLVALGLRDAIK